MENNRDCGYVYVPWVIIDKPPIINSSPETIKLLSKKIDSSRYKIVNFKPNGDDCDCGKPLKVNDPRRKVTKPRKKQTLK